MMSPAWLTSVASLPPLVPPQPTSVSPFDCRCADPANAASGPPVSCQDHLIVAVGGLAEVSRAYSTSRVCGRAIVGPDRSLGSTQSNGDPFSDSEPSSNI